MKLSLALDYTLPEGELAPYFDALRDGIALASRCNGCGHVAFPPRVLCAGCGDAGIGWVRLGGRAVVAFRTDGASESFAMVRFEGADTATLVGLRNPGATADTGHLDAHGPGRPGLWLRLDGGEEGDV